MLDSSKENERESTNESAAHLQKHKKHHYCNSKASLKVKRRLNVQVSSHSPGSLVSGSRLLKSIEKYTFGPREDSYESTDNAIFGDVTSRNAFPWRQYESTALIKSLDTNLNLKI